MPEPNPPSGPQPDQPWSAGLMPSVESFQAEPAGRMAVSLLLAAGPAGGPSSGDKAAIAALVVAVARDSSRG